MRTFTVLVDDLATKIGHMPLPGADLAPFAKGATVTDAEINKVFGHANHFGKGGLVDIDRLESAGWIDELTPAHPATPPVVAAEHHAEADNPESIHHEG